MSDEADKLYEQANSLVGTDEDDCDFDTGLPIHDYSKAIDYYLRAAELGHPAAQIEVFKLYAGGCNGFARDRNKAMEWGKRVAEYEDSPAEWFVYASFCAFKEFRGDLDEEGLRIAVEYFTKAAEAGHAASAICMGIIEDNGLVCTRDADGCGHHSLDSTAALRWYHKAYELGNVEAMAMIGQIYIEKGGEEDIKVAKHWFEKAVERKCELAGAYLGHMYRDGRGVDQDFGKAKELYDSNFCGESFYGLSILFRYGLGVPCLPEEVKRNLMLGLRFGCSRAIYDLNWGPKRGAKLLFTNIAGIHSRCL